MLNKIKSMRIEDMFEEFENDSANLDVMLCYDKDLFINVQNLLEDERRFSLVSLENEDLYNQRSILEGLYQVFFDECAPENEEALEIIEAVEDELEEDQYCLLIVEDFSACSITTQAALLELVIVSRAFKLLIKVEDSFSFPENEHLWKVLAQRSCFIEQNNSEFNEEFEQFEESDYEENEYIKPDEYEACEESEEINEEGEIISPQRKQEKALSWYQLVPKYHLVAGFFLFVLVIALWNMDVSQKKVQILDLATTDTHSIKKNSLDLSLESDVSESALNESNNKFNQESAQLASEESIDAKMIAELSTEAEEVISKQLPSYVSNDGVKQQEKSSENLVKKVVPVESKPTQSVKPVVIMPAETKKVDWSPYQSDSWIKGLNGKYFTLQLMASHDDQGIRNFLQERGVSSQYAVYTSEKNSKPWHVIIYGVYESRDFANLARKDLPTYLKDYSPWVRNIGEVQSSLK